MTRGDTSLLRGIAVATVAMPLALASIAASRTDQVKDWRQKPPVPDQKTTAGEQLAYRLRYVSPVDFYLDSASTSVNAMTIAPIQQSNASVVAGKPVAAETVDLDFITFALQQIAELSRMKAEDLPNEEPLQEAAIAAAFQTILELRIINAPKPQIVPRGDGGLQLVWYAPDRDLEIEIRPQGPADIVEFDGKRTRRVAYETTLAEAALARIRDSIASTSLSA